jgi:hypothetical protein
MAVHGNSRYYRWKEICTQHWLEPAKRCGFGEMKTIIQDLIARKLERFNKYVPVGLFGRDRGLDP